KEEFKVKALIQMAIMQLWSSSDSEKVIQRLNDELQEAQELAKIEKHKCRELQGILEEERKEKKQQADEAAKQIKNLQGQLQHLQDEMGVLREQAGVVSSSQKELQGARDETKALKRALESAASERDHDVAAVQAKLSTALKDADKWREMAGKYEREIDNLQRDLQQQSNQSRYCSLSAFTASELQSMQVDSLQSECASLRAEKEDLLKTQQKEKANLQSECAALRSENEALLQKQKQLEKDLSSLHSQNSELSGNVKALEMSQQELEKRLEALQLQHQRDSTNMQAQLEDADSRSKILQREYEETKTELSDLKEKYEQAEQEKRSLTEELDDCKTSLLLPVQAIVIGLILALLYWCFGALW
uniref:Sarcolemma associated protein b n=1 Tax=Takifugu rubripes TaxID=31033 RepID=A0A674P434_TAKRU